MSENTKINDGGSAFPYEERNPDGSPYRDYFGMTLRDYFAAKAMQSLIGNGLAYQAILRAAEKKGVRIGEFTADAAYSYADEMIAASNNRSEP